MTGISYRVEIEDQDLQAELTRMIAQMGDLRPFHLNVGEHLLNSVDDRFQGQHDPKGAPWKPLAPATAAKRVARGQVPLTILRARGHLAGSFAYQAGAHQVEIGSNLVYAAIHQFGGQAGRGRKVTIPARPILGLSPADEQEIVEIGKDHLNL
ncbi:MAG: phage virion morphogenesis protein [Hyphomicrobiales bacterium]|nr:phage virion morphogenesis protein [Hyphomicrobiales bacterium]